MRAHLVGVVGQLDAAGLAAAADLHLRLDHDRVADALGGGDGVVDRGDGLAGADRDAVAGEELLALVFVQVQGRGSLCWSDAPFREAAAPDGDTTGVAVTPPKSTCVVDEPGRTEPRPRGQGAGWSPGRGWCWRWASPSSSPAWRARAGSTCGWATDTFSQQDAEDGRRGGRRAGPDPLRRHRRRRPRHRSSSTSGDDPDDRVDRPRRPARRACRGSARSSPATGRRAVPAARLRRRGHRRVRRPRVPARRRGPAHATR